MFAASQLGAAQPSHTDRSAVARSLDVLPLSFEPNQGQAASNAKYFGRGRGFSALFKNNEADFLLTRQTGTRHLLRVKLPGSSRKASVLADSRLPGVVNYFNGNEPEKWHTGLPTFGRLRYTNIYPGIDLIYYGTQGHLEFDFQIAPGADPKSIRMRLEGAQSAKIDHDGNLIVTEKSGQISFQKPVIYQRAESNAKNPVAGSFKVLGKNTISFAVADYDHTRPLIIDPIFNYSTYIGPLAEVSSIAVDQNGEAYITGIATLDFPTTSGSYQPVGVPSSPANNIWPEVGKPFVAKLNSTGTALLYSTFLSGSGVDAAYGIALDANGNAIVVGSTTSTNFPITPGALQTTNSASQVTGFVTELNGTGASLVYSTYLGGSTSTSVNRVTIDTLGNAYLTGTTQDVNFPTTPGAYRAAPISKTTAGSNSAFIAKLNPTGTALTYSTYLGGSQTDAAFGIAVDSAGEAYVGGNTTSNDFPVTAGAIQNSREASNKQAGFVTKLNASGSALVFSTYLAGNDLDSVSAIAVDSNGNAYATGSTNSPDFPITAGAFQPNIGYTSFNYPQTNAFVSEINNSGTALTYSTFVGGGISLGVYADEGDQAYAIALDGQGMVYLTGMACTGNFPITAGAFEPQNLDGEIDAECTAFLTKMNPTPYTPLQYSTFLGGTGNGDPGDYFYGEAGNSLALDPSGNVYVAGWTISVDFPVTAGVVETPFTGISEEAFVTAFNAGEMMRLPIPTVALTSSASSVEFGQPITFTATVQPGFGGSTPTGYVGFNFFQQEASDDEGLGIGFGPWTTVPVNGSGMATFTTSGLEGLQTQVNAFYLGDANNSPATGVMTQTVTDIPTVTTVTSNANNVPYGTPVVFTATVLDNTGKPAKGFVFFLLGNSSYAEPTLNGAGQATWTNGTGGGPLPVGTDTVEVEFIPYTGYQQSIGTIAETFTALGVTPDPTFTPLAGTYTSAQQVTLADSSSAANIYYTTDGSTPVPGTSPQFLAGLTIPVNASETIKALAVAPGYTSSNVVSAAYTIPPSFSVTGTSVALSPGATSANTSTVSITPSGGFTGSVALAASITSGPAGAMNLPTLSFGSTTPVNIASWNAATATLTVSTTAPTTATGPAQKTGQPWYLTGGSALACILLCGLSTGRRRWQARFGLVLALIFLSGIFGCGGGSGGTGEGTGSPGTTAGTYTITVTGTSGSLTETGTVTLVVY